jgi:hypothetical protein
LNFVPRIARMMKSRIICREIKSCSIDWKLINSTEVVKESSRHEALKIAQKKHYKKKLSKKREMKILKNK